MSIIRIKRRSSGAAGAPSSLQNAELAFNEVDGILYYGKGTGGAGGSATTIEAIGGKAMVSLTGTETITGAKTFTSAVTIPDGTAANHAVTKGQLDAVTLTAGAVSSVAGKTGAVTLVVGDVANAASTSYVDTKVAALVNSAPSTLDTLNELATALGNDANFSTTVTNQLSLKVNASALATVATTGSYNDLLNKPTFDGTYASLTGKPTLATVATSGSYADLTNKPTLFDGTYASLTGKPALTAVAISGSYTDLTNKPTLFSGSYTDLTNKPTIPTQYTDAMARLAISLNAGSSGATYNSTTGVLDLSAVTGGSGGTGTVTSVALASSGSITISGSPITTNGTISIDVNAANLNLSSLAGTLSTTKITGLAAVATSGSYTDLTNKPSIPTQYTDAQARAAISVSGSLAYSSSTGVISYTAPTVVSAFTNDAGYLTAADLDGGTF